MEYYSPSGGVTASHRNVRDESFWNNVRIFRLPRDKNRRFGKHLFLSVLCSLRFELNDRIFLTVVVRACTSVMHERVQLRLTQCKRRVLTIINFDRLRRVEPTRAALLVYLVRICFSSSVFWPENTFENFQRVYSTTKST